MSYLVAIKGTVASASIKTAAGAPATVANWPANGAGFKGSFVYTPGTTPTPSLFSKIYVDFGSFTITRRAGIGNVSLPNGGAGVRYADGDSTGFNNVSLPAGGWQLQDFDLGFASPAGFGPAVNLAALDFNLFTERLIYAAGINGSGSPGTLTWTLLTRIDVAIVLPT